MSLSTNSPPFSASLSSCDLTNINSEWPRSPSDLQFIVSQAKENPPQDVEEAKTLLALARMDREMRKLEAQHADLAVSMNQAWTKYNSLRAAKAHKMVGTAESTVGRVRSIISKSGFSYPERVSILARPPTAPEEPSNRQPPVRFVALLD